MVHKRNNLVVRDIMAWYFYQFGYVHVDVAETVVHAYLMTRA